MLVVALLMTLVVPSGGGAAPSDGIGGSIAFVSDRDGNEEIYLMDADGSNPVNLTGDPSADWAPSWSPNGEQILFVSDRGGDSAIYVMNRDGSDPVRLAVGDHPAWSPDGRWIAYEFDSDIYVMAHDGSGPFPVTDSSSAVAGASWARPLADSDPAWSPDGTRLAFIRHFAGPTPLAGYAQLHVIDVGSTAPPVDLGYLGWRADGLDWSPDGTQIATGAHGNMSMNANLVLVNVDDSGTTTLPNPSGYTHNTDPSWSPDGGFIASTANHTSSFEIPFDIFITPVDGSGPAVNVTNTSTHDRYPAWGPIWPNGGGLNVVVLGGPGAVSDAVVRQVFSCAGPTVSRLTAPPSIPPLQQWFYVGSNRYLTATAVSATFFPSGADVVFVATGENFPDALAAGGAAGALNGPVLLVRRSGIPPETTAELVRLAPQLIIVLGGPAAISPEVEAALGPYAPQVARIGGSNRYETAALLSAFAFTSADHAFVTTGTDFPDGLTAGPAAAMANGPVLLTERDRLPPSTLAELGRLGVSSVTILGGTGAVTGSVEDALRSYVGDVTRLWGPTRYATAAAVSAATFPGGTPTIFIVTGENYPDGLSGAAAAAVGGWPILPVMRDSVPDSVRAELERLSGGSC